MLITDCWSHQINLILGDYYKANTDISAVVDNANEIIKWFNNHSFALGLLNTEQVSMSNRALALILPVVTCWTSHFCSVSRLLEVSKPMK
ncbi:hypothetical protein M405DRAFT_759096, partial [Rhizopogon salebrosus TDB-379]